MISLSWSRTYTPIVSNRVVPFCKGAATPAAPARAQKTERNTREAVALVADSEDTFYDPERGVVVMGEGKG